MRFPRIATWLAGHLIIGVAGRRAPDFIVGADNPDGAYLLRWYLTPWRHWQSQLRLRAEGSPSPLNRMAARAAGWLPNLYLHQFLRDDDDRALHDHPSWAASFILEGCYIEHTIADGGIHERKAYRAGSLRFLPTTHAHRIEVNTEIETQNKYDAEGNYLGTIVRRGKVLPCWTLFLFGPNVREWGFHCPERGWVPWQQFTTAGKPGEVGPGCGA